MTSQTYEVQSADKLAHIPGESGLPLLGQTLNFVYRPEQMPRDLYRRYGPLSRGHVYFEPVVHMIGPDANQRVLTDNTGLFSAQQGWAPILEHLFPGGLMLQDGEQHRRHRRIMQVAFKKDALAADLETMRPLVEQTLAGWPESMNFYPAIKRATLDMAAAVFFGLPLGPQADRMNRAFSEVVAASMAILRLPIPGTLHHRGQRSRRFLEHFFAELIPERRARPGNDLFSRLCTATDDDGSRFSHEEIVNHAIFTMMAAHDTTTSALTTLTYLLAKHPDWQARLRAEALAVGPAAGYESLHELADAGLAFREALRLYPPLPMMRRRSTRAFEFAGHEIPAGTPVNLYNHFSHHMEAYWEAPERFDPERFARNEHRRHPFQYIPFGAGAHTCIGLHFAEMQVKTVLHSLLQKRDIRVAPGYEMPYQLVPISRPRDGLPVMLPAR